MGQAKERSLALGITALVVATAACLPHGEPPSGRQIVADRGSTIGGLVPSNGDGVLRIAVLRPTGKADARDLYVVSLDAAGGPPSEQLLVPGIDVFTGGGDLANVSGGRIDPTGAVWVPANGELVRADAFTGERLNLGVASYSLSESGRRFFVSGSSFAPNESATGTLYEPDGRTTLLEVADRGAFYGEDFYYRTPQHAVMRVPPAGVPEQMATDVDTYWGLPTPDGILLMLNRETADPFVEEHSVRDPLTGRETLLPFSDSFVDLSADGRWLLNANRTRQQFVFLDYRAGAQKVIPFPDGYAGFGGYAWRAGTFQVWLTAGASDTPTVRVVSPDAPTVSVPGLAFMGLTHDGAHWYSTATSLSETYPVIEVGAADDPTGPRHLLTPPGTHSYEHWPLADGRELLAVYTTSVERSDIIAVDLDTAGSRVLAERGRMAAVGQTRFLGMFHLDEGRGDLTAVEIATGRQTILARELAATAFVEPQGDDLVAPGTRVVYQFLARTPSPYDGLWVVNAP